MKSIFASLIFVLSFSAWAHPKKTDATVHAIQTVIEKFNREEAASLPRYQGLKAGPDRDRYSVRIYLTQNVTLLYSCYEHVMNGQEMMMCDKVQQ